jgi:hypothetical protein
VAPAISTDPMPATVRDALLALVERMRVKLISEMTTKVAVAKETVAGAADDARANARNTVDAALPPRFPGTEQQRCGFFDVVCLLKNGVKSMANSAYQNSKKRQLASMQAEIDELHHKQELQGDQLAAATNAVIDYRTNMVADASKTAIIQMSRALTFIGWVFALYSVLVLLKSFAVVFARVFYFQNTVRHAASATDRFGKVKSDAQEFIVPNNSATKYYASIAVIGPNVIERKRIPHWSKMIIRRILSGNYILSYIDTQLKGQGACELRVSPPGELVVWTLVKGEEVIFHMRDFAAMSADLRLSSQVSLRLSSLIFGRVIYHVATGPGVLILKTHSTAIVGATSQAQSAHRASGVIAWNVNNEFNVISSLNIVDTFFSGSSLKMSPGDLIVCDTAVKGSTTLGGIWRTGRHFLLPF